MSLPALDELVARGWEELRAGRHPRALDMFQGVLHRDPFHPEGRRGQFEALCAYFPLYPILLDLLPSDARHRFTDLMSRLVRGAGWEDLVDDLLATLVSHPRHRALALVLRHDELHLYDSRGHARSARPARSRRRRHALRAGARRLAAADYSTDSCCASPAGSVWGCWRSSDPPSPRSALPSWQWPE